MDTFSIIPEVQQQTKTWSKQGFSIGFVPTMGYLHSGHASLIKQAKLENDKVVVTSFVNPIQFGPSEDYERYPKNFTQDQQVCEIAGADLLFVPSVTEIFPEPNLAFIDISQLSDTLCGAKRPGHFRGVCTIVAKFFHIIRPDRAYFGEKDLQQLIIIQRMTQDLNFDIQIIPCPTIRDQDGLALSSRNAYLSPLERKAAQVIPDSLNLARTAIAQGASKAAAIKNIISQHLETEKLAKIDYIEVVDSQLKSVSLIDSESIVALAVFIGTTRLIDHFCVKEVLL